MLWVADIEDGQATSLADIGVGASKGDNWYTTADIIYLFDDQRQIGGCGWSSGGAEDQGDGQKEGGHKQCNAGRCSKAWARPKRWEHCDPLGLHQLFDVGEGRAADKVISAII
jgi:hypothetical protein